MECKSGIYRVTNLVNGKVYIGSAINLRRRKQEHFSMLKRNRHSNNYLQNSYNKHGIVNFNFEVIEYVEDKTKLINIEQVHLNNYVDSEGLINTKLCYNICPTAGSNLGIKFTEEQNKRNSERNKGRKHSEKTKIKMGNSRRGKNNPNYNKPMTKERKEKLKKANEGRIKSKEELDKIIKALKGHKVSRATREKIRKAVSVKVINLTTNEVFDSLDQAAKIYKLFKSNICKVCQGLRKTTGGYTWAYYKY